MFRKLISNFVLFLLFFLFLLRRARSSGHDLRFCCVPACICYCSPLLFENNGPWEGFALLHLREAAGKMPAHTHIHTRTDGTQFLGCSLPPLSSLLAMPSNAIVQILHSQLNPLLNRPRFCEGDDTRARMVRPTDWGTLKIISLSVCVCVWVCNFGTCTAVYAQSSSFSQLRCCS